MRKTLLILLIFLSACSGRLDLTASEEMFVGMMIPHHEQAIEMADFALKYSENPKIKKLARNIKASQQPEIDLMSSFGKNLAELHAGHTMQGMLSERDMRILKFSRGKLFDEMFLFGMIQHHEGAIEMAKTVLSSKTPEISKLANEIIRTQSEEIELMKILQEEINSD